MRSRYSAFVEQNEPYLLATWHPDTRPSRVRLADNQRWLGLSINTMTLGGLAIAIGVMVDASVVMVENAHKRLERARDRIPAEPTLIAGVTELYLALARQLEGNGILAIQDLRQRTEASDPAAFTFLSRLVAAEVFVHLLDGGLPAAAGAARRTATPRSVRCRGRSQHPA